LIVLGGLVRGWVGKGVGEVCVDSRLFWGDWIKGGEKGRECWAEGEGGTEEGEGNGREIIKLILRYLLKY